MSYGLVLNENRSLPEILLHWWHYGVVPVWIVKDKYGGNVGELEQLHICGLADPDFADWADFFQFLRHIHKHRVSGNKISNMMVFIVIYCSDNTPGAHQIIPAPILNINCCRTSPDLLFKSSHTPQLFASTQLDREPPSQTTYKSHERSQVKGWRQQSWINISQMLTPLTANNYVKQLTFCHERDVWAT